MTAPTGAARGRPRQFDRDQALLQAMHIFWERGFEGTSLADLSSALGLTATSIYAAFGSKQALFREAVELYVSSDGNATWRALETSGTTRQAIEAMLRGTVDAFCNADTPRGCLMLLADKGLGRGNDSVKAFLQQWRAKTREQLRARLQRGVDAGELPVGTDAAAMASIVVVFLNGISIETADGVSQQDLLKAVDVFLSSWPWSDVPVKGG